MYISAMGLKLVGVCASSSVIPGLDKRTVFEIWMSAGTVAVCAIACTKGKSASISASGLVFNNSLGIWSGPAAFPIAACLAIFWKASRVK